MPRDPRTYLWDATHAADLISSFVRGAELEGYLTDDLATQRCSLALLLLPEPAVAG